MNWRLMVLGPVILASCQGAPKKGALSQPPPPLPPRKALTVPPASFVAPTVQQLTFQGDNANPALSSDGNRLLFVSQNRDDHTHFQLYELIISALKERRITHQDGEVTSPAYVNQNNEILYASTTDEAKENFEHLVARIKGTQASLSPTGGAPSNELYLSRADGSAIRRLTNSKSMDSEASSRPGGRKLVFTSSRSGNLDLFSIDLVNHALSRITQNPAADRFGRFSPDGKKLAWIRKDQDSSHIITSDGFGGHEVQITKKKGNIDSLSWLPNGQGILFSSDRDEPANMELYIFENSTGCVRRLTYDGSNEIEPIAMPDGKRIIFASNRTGRKQLFLMDLTSPETCVPESL